MNQLQDLIDSKLEKCLDRYPGVDGYPVGKVDRLRGAITSTYQVVKGHLEQH